MYQIEYDGEMLTPVVDADDAIYWADRLGKLIPRRSAQIIQLDWLPETNPPTNTRPGAEYGVEV